MGGTQLAIDTTLVSPLTRHGQPRRRAGHFTACTKQGGDKKYRNSSWVKKPLFVTLLSQAKARQAPGVLKASLIAALISRWTALLSHAAMQTIAASLLAQECSSHANVEGNEPAFSQLRKGTPPQHQPHPPTSPVLRSFGLGLATSRAQSLETD